MARTRELKIQISGDASGARKAFNHVNQSADGVKGKLGGLAGKAKLAFAGIAGGAALLGKASVDAASDLAETLSKSNTVFGKSAKAIETFADNAAKNLGQSKQEALAAASSFGNMFSQLGIGEAQTAAMSQQMVILASDFASFHNADISEVISAQEAAFRGEYDAVQKFVPTINAAAVEQKALEMGLGKTTKELDAQDKALATQALLTEGAGDAAGDFERTSGSLANKQRILSAKFKDVQAKIGTYLIPAISALVGFVSDKLVPALMELGNWLSDHKPVLIAFGIAVGVGLVVAFTAWAMSAWAAATATIAATWPVIAITAAIAALVAGVIWAYNNWDWFRNAVDRVAKFVTGTLWPALQRIAGWITGTLIPVIGRIIGTFGSWASKVAEVARSIVGKVGDIVGVISRTPGNIARAASGMFDGIKNAFRSAINFVIRGWNSLQFKIPGFDPPGPGPKFGGMTIGVPKISQLAEGGIVSARPGGILANIGEGRYDEAVVPLDGKHSFGNTVINVAVHVDGSVISQRELIGTINNAIAKGIRLQTR